jgi:hypothetical protein
MGVKAKEIIRRESSSFKSLLFMMVLLVAFQYGYAFLIQQVSESSQSVVSGIAMAISLSITFFVVRKVLPWYQVELADKTLNVYKSLFVKPRPILAIPTKEIVSVKTVDETEDFSGRKLNYTIFGIKDKKKYVIHWKREQKDLKIILQLGEDFADKLRKECVRVRKK